MTPSLTRRFQALSLIASGVVRAAGEIIQIAANGQTRLSGLSAALALFAFAVGVTGIWTEARQTLVGRIATVATILGALSFVALTLDAVLLKSVPSTQEVARTLPFLISAVLTLIGVFALAVFLMRSPNYPAWIGVVLGVTVLGSIVTSILDTSPIVQPLIDIVMALSFLQFGLAMLRPGAYASPRSPKASATAPTWRKDDTP